MVSSVCRFQEYTPLAGGGLIEAQSHFAPRAPPRWYPPLAGGGTAALSTTRNRIGHALRDAKQARGQSLSEAEIARIPEIVARPKAVLLDTDGDMLIYAFDSPDGERRMGKLVWQINFRGNRGWVTNSYRSAGYVERYNLRESNYVLLYGDLEERE